MMMKGDQFVQAVEKEIEDHRAKETPDSWVQRDSRLIPLTGPMPFNAEPPSCELMHSLITPTSLHYVRNHGPVPKLDWSQHQLSVTGLVARPKTYSMDELVRVAEPMQLIVTLACDGNRRKELNLQRHTRGFHWGPGGCSTAVWRGIRIADLLRDCGDVTSMSPFLHINPMLISNFS
jgi:nitrate reductase (NAD(P)H)